MLMNNILTKVLILTVYVTSSSVGLYYIKASQMTVMSWKFVIGFILYGSGFLIWLYLLKLYPLSTIFPIAASALIVATQLLGYTLLHEQFHVSKLVSIILIIVGIIILFRYEA